MKQRSIIKNTGGPECSFCPRAPTRLHTGLAQFKLRGYPQELELQATLAKITQSQFKDGCRTVKMDLQLASYAFTESEKKARGV